MNFQGLRLQCLLSHLMLIFLFVLFHIPSLSKVIPDRGSIYYVDPQGDDTYDGLSPTRPWKTLSRVAEAALVPGDIVKLRGGGVWNEPLIVSASGSPESPLRFTRYGDGPKPRIDCTRQVDSRVVDQREVTNGIRLNLYDSGTNQVFLNGERLNEVKSLPLRPHDYSIKLGLLRIELDPSSVYSDLRISLAIYSSGILCKGRTNIILDNLEVSGSRGSPGVIAIIDSNRVTVRGCIIGNSRGFGVGLASASNVKIEDCKIHNCGLTGIGTSGEGAPSHHVVVRNNNIYRIGWLAMDRFNDGHGIGVGNLPGCNHWLIEGNEISECGRGGGEEYNDGGCGPGITAWETHDIIIRRNLIHDNYRGGITLELGGQSKGDNHEVYYNLIYRNGRNSAGKRPSGTGWSGIGVYKFVSNLPVDNIKIINNVIAYNYLGFPGACSSGIYLTVAGLEPMTNVLVANNIIYNNGNTNYEFWRRSAMVQLTMHNNLFYRSEGKVIVKNIDKEFNIHNYWQFVSTVCDGCITGDPGFLNPSDANFHLEDSSICRGYGIGVSGIHDVPGAIDIEGNTFSQYNHPSCGVYY